MSAAQAMKPHDPHRSARMQMQTCCEQRSKTAELIPGIYGKYPGPLAQQSSSCSHQV